MGMRGPLWTGTVTATETAVDEQRISGKGEKNKGVGQYRRYNIKSKLNEPEHYDHYRIGL